MMDKVVYGCLAWWMFAVPTGVIVGIWTGDWRVMQTALTIAAPMILIFAAAQDKEKDEAEK